ncbi:MAG: hypothetical protein AB4426_03850 [Xenococcaceae cyanobacterium]
MVQQYVDDVVKACGSENQDAAQLVLFLLTDEHNIRPLKNLKELERDLNAWSAAAKAENLSLLLSIFVESELVVFLKPSQHYQLAHDYLVAIIRKQQPKLQEVIAKLENTEKGRIDAEKRRIDAEKGRRIRNRLLVFAGLVILVFSLLLFQVKKQNLWIKISQLNSRYQTQILLNNQLEALVTIVNAGRRFAEPQIWTIPNEILDKETISNLKETISNLSEAVYLIRERNRLKFLNTVLSVSFSPDGETIATADGNTVKLYQDGKLINTLKGHQDFVWCVSFSPDNQIIASASADKTVKLWRRDGQFIKNLWGHKRAVNSVSFSPNGEMIASASDDRTVKLWRRDGQFIKDLWVHKIAVNSVSFSPNGEMIASASDDRTVKLWRRNGQFIKDLWGHERAVNSVSFSPNGEIIASASTDDTIKLWNGNGGTLITTLQGHKDVVNQVNFHPISQRKMLASASNDHTVRLWHLENLPQVFKLPDQVYGYNVSLSPDGKTLAATSRFTDELILVDWQASKLIDLSGDLSEYKGKVNGISFSPDGKMIASASDDGTVKLWNRDGQLLRTLEEHTDRVNNIRFSPDGKMIASASDDGTVKLWYLDGTLLKTIANHTNPANDVSFSAGSQLIASVSDDKILISKPDGTLIKTLEPPPKVRSDFWSISLSPNGKIVAAGTTDGYLILWRSKDISWKKFDTITTTEPGHRKIIYSLSFWPNPDSQILASAGREGTVKIWNQDGILLATLKLGKGVKSMTWVNFTQDGKTLVSIDEDANMSLWRLEFDELNDPNYNVNYLLTRACEQLGNYLDNERLVNENEELRDWCSHQISQ